MNRTQAGLEVSEESSRLRLFTEEFHIPSQAVHRLGKVTTSNAASPSSLLILHFSVL